ncbi:MAG: NupC/NupG family nucleoside CNT transporter [Alphaproteobacteria bacterium]
MEHLQSAFGLAVLLALAWAVSENRAAVRGRIVWPGLALSAALGIAMLELPALRAVFAALARAVGAVAEATRTGTAFVFGYLGGGDLPFEPSRPEHVFVLAFQALPIVVVMSALTALLFHWRIIPLLVRGAAIVLRRTLGVGGAVGLSTAANIFVGMVEAPLVIRPYLARLTRGEMFIVMTGGMAGIAGTVMVLYAVLLAPIIPEAFGHILIASVLGAPLAIVVGHIMVPDSGGGADCDGAPDLARATDSAMDAVARGTQAGVELLINIVASLVVLVALVALTNAMLGLVPDIAGAPVTLQRALGLAMAPVCWLMGVPWAEAQSAGALMGVKTVLNELIAYAELARLPPEALSPRSRLIMLYALCGFANFGSLGIMIAGLSTMAPTRRGEIVGLGMKSIVSGTLCTCLLGAFAGLWF